MSKELPLLNERAYLDFSFSDKVEAITVIANVEENVASLEEALLHEHH